MYSKSHVEKKLIGPKDWSSFFSAECLMDRERQRGTAKDGVYIYFNARNFQKK